MLSGGGLFFQGGLLASRMERTLSLRCMVKLCTCSLVDLAARSAVLVRLLTGLRALLMKPCLVALIGITPEVVLGYFSPWTPRTRHQRKRPSTVKVRSMQGQPERYPRGHRMMYHLLKTCPPPFLPELILIVNEKRIGKSKLIRLLLDEIEQKTLRSGITYGADS